MSRHVRYVIVPTERQMREYVGDHAHEAMNVKMQSRKCVLDWPAKQEIVFVVSTLEDARRFRGLEPPDEVVTTDVLPELVRQEIEICTRRRVRNMNDVDEEE